MTEPEDNSISRLLALKRYERMPEGFEDQLIHQLHLRQRADLMNQSLRSIIAERLQDFWESLSGPRLALAAAAAVAVLFGVITWLPGGANKSGEVASQNVKLSDQPLPPGFQVLPPDLSTATANFGTTPPPDESARLSPLLLSKHFVGGYSDERRESLAPEFVQPQPRAQFDVMPNIGFGDSEAK
jgi:hypothetical protein